MNRRFLASLGVVAVVALAPLSVVRGQAPAAKARSTRPAAALKTPWGDPDLQGMWSNNNQVPFQRPEQFKDKEFLTDEEVAALEKQTEANRDRPPAKGQVGLYNSFWLERGKRANRTSQITDPPNGRLPPLTSQAQARYDDALKRRGNPSHWEDRDMYERCITRGMPGAMIPGFYNHVYQILQSPGYVVILVEMIHDARIIPVDGRPALPGIVKQWMGDSRGRWEGNTLVVETANLNGKNSNAYVFSLQAGESARVTERFTRVDANTIDYSYSVNDPGTWTKPWSGVAPMLKAEEGLFEYACHEGNNYSMENIIKGTLTEKEKKAEREGKNPE